MSRQRRDQRQSGSSDGRSLTRSTTSGLAWSWAAIGITAGMRLAYTAVVSRVVTPSDFGLIAGAMLGLGFVSYLSKSGIGTAMVQRQSMSPEVVAAGLGLAVLFGVVTCAATLLLSEPLALLVREPQVAVVVRWMSLGVLLAALASVPEALLRRAMNFRALAVSQILSFGVGYLGVGVSMALASKGVWSLVAANLSQTVVSLVAMAVLARLPLRLSVNRQISRELLTFGGVVGVTNFVEYLSMNLDSLTVARFVGTAPLGQYARSTYIVSLPLEQMTSATSRVLLPALSSVQDEPERFKRGFLAATTVYALMVVVPVAFAAASAPVLVRVVLGSGWEVAASVLPLTSSAYGLALLTQLLGLASEAKGVVVRKLVVQLVALVVLLMGMVFVVLNGATLHSVAAAWLVAEAVRLMMFLVKILPATGVPVTPVLHRYVSVLIFACLVAVPVAWVVQGARPLGLPAALVGCLVVVAGTAAAFASPTSRVLKADVRMAISNSRR